ncbi:MAG: type IV secretion system DNA-binding domain-containing protein [Methylibium sp.]|uniref:type IV secretion system DNA-binding domain-containing protein n=1 Tax=Methylibium sp. TaxID=2067992 RepID=UPI0018586457|nr:type IV secretion system DNA-binding domain-containing protein [Methylibium sp.]MBA3598871.1 type IV secretion system DNA-binding domain-containing protein [Methylibium sp.]
MSHRHRLLTLGGCPWPAALETLHLLVAGTTGSGKTTLIEELLDGITARGERSIVCDPNGGYLSRFARTGDRLLNPFDSRTEGWCLFNEIRSDFDAERLAGSVVPAGHGESAAWHHYAQVLLAEVLRALVRSGETSSERLLYWCTSAPARELGTLLVGTPAAGLFDEGADKALASTRFVLTAHLSPHRYLKPGAFSLRDWLECEDGSLFMTWRADMQAALAPLLATWADIVTNAVLTLPPDPARRLWLVLDELAALGKLNGLESGLTLGRKHGLAVVAALQSTAQLDRLYGRESATVLRSCFRNLMVLAIAKSDPATADELSRSLGEREVLRHEVSRSSGASGLGESQSLRQAQERLVLPSEIASLPNLEAFLALAGDEPVRRVRLTPHRRDEVADAFVQEDAC